MARISFVSFAPLLVALSNIWTFAQEPDAKTNLQDTRRAEFFETKIRPVLVKHCYECHSQAAKKNRGGLYLDSRKAMLKGGDSGESYVAGQADQSLLMAALNYEDLEMPPDGKLDQAIIDDFRKWITDGAVDPRTETGTPIKKPSVDWEKAAQHWSLQPLTRQALPRIQDAQWPANRIDYFVMARLEQEKLLPARPATNRELLRRLSFDLVGLPTRLEQLETEQHVETLLSSPAFGENWARLWLDIARYAEDQAHIVGNNKALFYPNAFLFRDWVIEAFNSDLPYDRFVREQLSIDLIAKNENRKPDDRELAALGFIGLGPKYYRRNDLSVMADEWEDRVDTVSRGLLGLTVACARCHDHKYDPISTEDYYAMAGVFASTEMYNKPRSSTNVTVNDKKKKKKTPVETLHIVKDKKPNDLNVFVRGDPENRGPKVGRRFLSVLDPEKKQFSPSNSGRLDLAQAITNKDNPLFARVIVNRVWGRLIGAPLVRTQSNFGALGELPSHPRLLDDLAFRFIANGWSIKWLIREIVSSNTYRQSSRGRSAGIDQDPANRFLSRMNRKRLTVEQWRDAILFSSNHIQNRVGGKSINPSDPKQSRRTVYSRISRFQLDPMLALFDFPDPNAHAAQRSSTISPLQKMFSLNSPFLLEHSQKLYTSLLPNNKENSPVEMIHLAYHKLFQREPIPLEEKWAIEFLQSNFGATSKSLSTDHAKLSSPGSKKVMEEKWSAYLQSLLISNEFTFVD